MLKTLLTLLAAASLALCGVTGYRLGVNVTEGRQAIERQQAVKAALTEQTARLAAETERARRAEQQRVVLERRIKEIDHAQSVPVRDCRLWTDDERGLLESRRRAYTDVDAAGALSGALSGDAANRSGRAAERERSSGLGLRLPGAAAGLPGLDR